MQLKMPNKGINGWKGVLNVLECGIFFLSLTTARFATTCVDKIMKLVTATVCLKSRTSANEAVTAPMIRMEM